jgi:hypothetical protein
MNSPPVKERAGDLAATSPKLFDEADHTPLVCSAQDECEHSETRVEQLANGPHFAKEICTACGRVLRWLPRPETLTRRRFNALRIAKLAMSDELTDWEREFLKNVAAQRKLSSPQQACLDRLAERLKGTAHAFRKRQTTTTQTERTNQNEN